MSLFFKEITDAFFMMYINEDLVAVYDELFMAITDETFYDEILCGFYNNVISYFMRGAGEIFYGDN